MNDRSDRGEYYLRTLESERTGREQSDKQVIDLLYDIRNRYDIKLGSYMARNKKNKNSPKNENKKEDTATKINDDSKGWNDTANNDWENNTNSWGNNNTWSNEANETKNNEESGWEETGDNNGNQDSGWGNSASKNDNQDSGWGNSANTNDNQDSGWGNTEVANDNQESNWDSAETATKDQVSKPSSDEKKNKQSSSGDQKSSTDKSDKTASAPQDGAKTDNQKSKSSSGKKKDKQPCAGDPKTPTDKPDATTPACTDGSRKSYDEIKSELWTMKLDLRLSEREKQTLKDEVISKQCEIDELSKKLTASREQIDDLKLKVRKLTVDLCSANQDIQKSSARLDEIENQSKIKEDLASYSESKRRTMEHKSREQQQRIADLESELYLVKEEKELSDKRVSDQAKRIQRLEADLGHSRNLVQTLKDGCTLVENQAKAFEVRHNTVVMSKEDLERELIAIKEESSRHITTISKLQKSNEQISKAFVISVEAHDECKKEMETVRIEMSRRIETLKIENLRLVEANSQLRKLVDYLQNKR